MQRRLPARSRALLAALARTVDANRPYAAIFARRELLTGRAMQSMRTFYRSLDDLEAAGPHRAAAPETLRGGRPVWSRLPPSHRKSCRAPGSHRRRSLNVKARVCDSGLQTAPKRRHSAVTIFPLTVRLPPWQTELYIRIFSLRIKRDNQARSRAISQRLLNLGFHEFLIFKLMREAKQHGKLLSDVVEATWNHLSIAKRPISYVRSLLRSPVDFGQQLRARELKVQEKHDIAAKVRAVEEIAKRHAGHVFYDIGTTRRFEISIDATEITIHDCREPRARISASGWKGQFATALTEKHLVRSCHKRDTVFLEKCQGTSYVPSNRSFAISPQGETRDARRKPTEAISNRLRDMKQLLRAACAGANRDRAVQGARPNQPKTA